MLESKLQENRCVIHIYMCGQGGRCKLLHLEFSDGNTKAKMNHNQPSSPLPLLLLCMLTPPHSEQLPRYPTRYQTISLAAGGVDPIGVAVREGGLRHTPMVHNYEKN